MLSMFSHMLGFISPLIIKAAVTPLHVGKVYGDGDSAITVGKIIG